MNKFRKILSSVIAAAIVLSGGIVSVGAATQKNSCIGCETKKIVVSCDNQKIYDYLKSFGNKIRWKYPPAQTETKPSAKPESQPVTQPEKQTAPQVDSSSEFNQAYENEVISLCNAERAKYGLAALTKRDDATSAARIRAKEIVQSFSHTRPDGTSCFSVCKQLGITYPSAGENIAYGYRTPAQVVSRWMNSEGHRKNILSASFTSIGVGCYQQGGTLYWSQMFLG